jgi:uncharacterized protein
MAYGWLEARNLMIKQNITALIAGISLGLGLGLSQMIDRDRVLGFLDVAGRWDPTLLFVLGGAVTVTVIVFRLVLRLSKPIFASQFELPQRNQIDRALVIGSIIFGVGWGISGYCPGPGIVALAFGDWNPVMFVSAFVMGSLLHWRYRSHRFLKSHEQ